MKPKNYIVLFHPTVREQSVRIDFESEEVPSFFFNKLKIEGYGICQFIDAEFIFNMSEFELGKLQVPYFSFEREKKTWFGLSRKTVSDLLILPNEGFFYPYTYGHYFYLYTKQKIEKAAFENWIHSTFPNKYADFDYTYAGLNKGEIELMHKDDYLIITNHDFQDGFGVIGGSQILNTLIERLRRMELKAFDEEIEE